VSNRFRTVRSERLTTERLLLEPLTTAHAAEMVTVLDDPSLHRYVGGEPLGFHELERRYERQSRGRSEDESERWFNWIIRDRTSQEAVGYVQATVEVETRVANVAWVVGSRYQARGYAREAARAMLSWLYGNGATAVTARIHPENRASEIVAAALGLRHTPTSVDGESVWTDRPKAKPPMSHST